MDAEGDEEATNPHGSARMMMPQVSRAEGSGGISAFGIDIAVRGAYIDCGSLEGTESTCCPQGAAEDAGPVWCPEE